MGFLVLCGNDNCREEIHDLEMNAYFNLMKDDHLWWDVYQWVQAHITSRSEPLRLLTMAIQELGGS